MSALYSMTSFTARRYCWSGKRQNKSKWGPNYIITILKHLHTQIQNVPGFVMPDFSPGFLSQVTTTTLFVEKSFVIHVVGGVYQGDVLIDTQSRAWDLHLKLIAEWFWRHLHMGATGLSLCSHWMHRPRNERVGQDGRSVWEANGTRKSEVNMSTYSLVEIWRD